MNPDSLTLTQESLILLPCSKAKRQGNGSIQSASILSGIDPRRAELLSEARAALRERAQINESSLMPAYERYCGYLYKPCESSIRRAVANGRKVVIVSGGYGLLLAEEPIGEYDKAFVCSDWPKNLLEDCLLEFATKTGAQNVFAIMSKTTSYAKFVTAINWRAAGLRALLISPVPMAAGNMIKVPRAQGEAVATLLDRGIPPKWLSSDSLSLEVREI